MNLQINRAEFNKWVEALESGEYAQGRGQLQSKEGYCCLGVACKVLIPEEKQQIENGLMVGGLPINQNNSPIWLLNLDKCIIKYKGYDDSLPNLNDNARLSFKEIAKILRENFPEDSEHFTS